MTSISEKESFWDRKILPWEKKSYDPGRVWGSPLKWRRKLFLEKVRPLIKGKTVLELGAGSCQMMGDLFAMGIAKYLACDLSAIAIEEAKKNAAHLGVSQKVELQAGDMFHVMHMSVSADLTFSLGLLDWLSDEEIAAALERQKSPYYLHSYSEKRFSVSQFLHRAYVYSAYGHRNPDYMPAYRDSKKLADTMQRLTGTEPKIIRDHRMSFSAFISHLPEPHRQNSRDSKFQKAIR